MSSVLARVCTYIYMHVGRLACTCCQTFFGLLLLRCTTAQSLLFWLYWSLFNKIFCEAGQGMNAVDSAFLSDLVVGLRTQLHSCSQKSKLLWSNKSRLLAPVGEGRQLVVLYVMARLEAVPHYWS